MATITIKNTGAIVEASPAVSILNNLLQSDISISHVCGGKAQCGTCRIEIIEGEQYLSPVTKEERIRLAKFGNPEHARLACQTYSYGDIIIRIVLPRSTGR